MKLNLLRFTTASYALVVLAVLCAAGGVYLVLNNLGSSETTQRCVAVARVTAANLEALITQYKEMAQRLATRAAGIGLINDNKAGERSTFVEQHASAMPQVSKLRLLPVGAHDIDTTSVPELSYACLDLLTRREKGQPVPEAEVHLYNTPSAHFDVSAPVLEPADKHILGHVLLSIDTAVLKTTLAAFKPEDGFAELRQIATKGEFLTLASNGNSGLRLGEPVVLQSISGTNWRLAIWPAAVSWSPSIGELGLYAGLAFLTLTLLVLSVLLPRRWQRAALRHDTGVLGTLFGDIRNGVLMGYYPFRLQEFEVLARDLRNTGEGMIADRRNLEKQTQVDALTGAKARPAFDTKLAHLHSQARLGLSSALLVTDIDHFEEINTQLGPDAGDILLKQFARQLLETLRQSDMVARLEGGKFAVLFPFTDLEKISPVIERLHHRLAEEFDPGSGMPRAFSWSGGLTLISRHDPDANASLVRARAALIEAHEQGGNRTLTHSPAS